MTTLDETLNLMGLFGESARLRLLALLAQEELSVAELTHITGLAQSRVSTHLGKLKDAGLLRDRREGNSTRYALRAGALPESAARLWALLESSLDDALLDGDRRRSLELIAAREAAAGWPDTIAGQMERHYSPGRTWEAFGRGLVGLLRLGDVLDVGSGDGVITQLIAPHALSVTALDRSEKIIAAARTRLADVSNVRFQVGDMHELPFAPDSFDQVLLFNSLTYSHGPERAIAEVARVLRPAGSLAVITLAEHAHDQVTRGYSHLNTGFSPDALRGLLEGAGLSVSTSEVSSREKRKPYFEVVTAFASRC